MQWLDRLLTLILISVVVYGIFVLKRPPTDAPADPYKIGQPAPPLASVDYTKSRATLLVFLRTTCIYCTESMPLYASLLTQTRSSTKQLKGELGLLA